MERRLRDPISGKLTHPKFINLKYIWSWEGVSYWPRKKKQSPKENNMVKRCNSTGTGQPKTVSFRTALPGSCTLTPKMPSFPELFGAQCILNDSESHHWGCIWFFEKTWKIWRAKEGERDEPVSRPLFGYCKWWHAMLLMGVGCGGGIMVLKPMQNVRRVIRAENKLCRL